MSKLFWRYVDRWMEHDNVVIGFLAWFMLCFGIAMAVIMLAIAIGLSAQTLL